MKEHCTEIRVRYGETDQMGFVYYGAYATYFEVARVELLRACGVTYKNLETNGILMPVTQYEIQYIRPARYDDLLKVNTAVESLTAARIRFKYDIHIAQTKICEATTTLAFLNAKTMRPMKCPELLSEMFSR